MDDLLIADGMSFAEACKADLFGLGSRLRDRSKKGTASLTYPVLTQEGMRRILQGFRSDTSVTLVSPASFSLSRLY